MQSSNLLLQYSSHMACVLSLPLSPILCACLELCVTDKMPRKKDGMQLT